MSVVNITQVFSDVYVDAFCTVLNYARLLLKYKNYAFDETSSMGV